MNKLILREVADKHRNLILEPYDVIMDLQGFDAIYAFAEQLGGCTVYIPSVKTIFQKCVEQEAVKNFKGNYNSIARTYGFSERHLRRLIDGK